MLEYAEDRPWPGATAWSDAESRRALAAIAGEVEHLTGYEVACINVVHHGVLRTVAVHGTAEQQALLMDSHTPVDVMEAELGTGDVMGRFVFVPATRGAANRTWGVCFDVDIPDDPAADYDIDDVLVAPVRDPDGLMVGLLCVDVPRNRRRADAATQLRLERYAALVEPVVQMALRRAQDEERARLARAAHQVVAAATRELSPQTILDSSAGALTAGFRTNGLWLHIFDVGIGQGAVHGTGGILSAVPRILLELSESFARRAWRAEGVQMLCSATYEHVPPVDDVEIHGALSYLSVIGIDSVLLVPLGAGQDCLGALVLGRRPGGTRWTEAEVGAAKDIGRDLGRAILNARAFEREQRAVVELQALDSYKSQLVATLSHELKTPLTSILGNLELLEDGLGADDQARSLAAISRGSNRLVSLVDDLMLLAKVGDPGNMLVSRPVDLVALVREIVELTAATAKRAGVEVDVTEPGHPVVTVGDAGELDRVVSNLVSNALKYTPHGGRVLLDVRREGDEVVFVCADSGIGIDERDHARLFDEFFRSPDPAARGRPGTGLGLAITDRIVRRHGGRIEVSSGVGAGTRFEVHLPGPTQDDDAHRSGDDPVATTPAARGRLSVGGGSGS